MYSRRELLRNAKTLRKSSLNIFKYVYVCPDLTPLQREQNNKLEKELSDRKNAGETNLVIKRGSIVQRSSAILEEDRGSPEA
jgi:hypothetical protein